MIRLFATFFVLLISNAAFAHEQTQECFTPEQMFANNEKYNQVPLFSTNIYKFDENNDMIKGEALFVLNVTEGHWTLYSKYDTLVCIEAYGDEFKDKYEGN